MKNVVVALCVSNLSLQPQNCQSEIESHESAEPLLHLPLPFPQISFPPRSLLNLNWFTQKYSSETEGALCIFQGCPASFYLSGNWNFQNQREVKKKNHCRAHPSLVAQKFVWEQGLQNRDSPFINAIYRCIVIILQIYFNTRMTILVQNK